MSSNALDRALLRNLPAARVSTAGAVLPLAADDPHPAMTLALHQMWATIRPLVLLEEGNRPSLVPQGSVRSPLQFLETVSPFLVCLIFLLRWPFWAFFCSSFKLRLTLNF